MKHKPDITPKPGDPNFAPPAHFAGAVYYWGVQVGHPVPLGGEILGEDEDGNEVPAANGYYWQQWDPRKDQGIDGYFGPYERLEDMPDYVQANWAAGAAPDQ